MEEKDYPGIIQRVIKYQEALTDWELDFITSLYSRVIDKNIPPTEKQAEVLLKIQRRVIKDSINATGRSWR